MESVTAKTQMAKIRSFEKGFMATHLINLGAKAGIFKAFNENKEGMTVTELASRIDLHEPFLKIWCQTAYHFEILDADEKGRFKLQPFLDEILGDKDHFRNYLANIYMDVSVIGEGMAEAYECFKTGKAIEIYQTPEFSKTVYEPTKNIALAFLFMIFPKNEQLQQSLEKGTRFLDIGCGNGDLILQLAQTFGNSNFVGIGPDVHGIEEAKYRISELGLENRVSVEHMGGEDIPYKEEFNIASMVVTLHEITADVRVQAVKKAYQALKNGGHFLVLDFPYPNKLEDFRNSLYDYGILDQFYEICAGTVHLNNQQQDDILKIAGFENVRRQSIGKGMFDFIIATK